MKIIQKKTINGYTKYQNKSGSTKIQNKSGGTKFAPSHEKKF